MHKIKTGKTYEFEGETDSLRALWVEFKPKVPDAVFVASSGDGVAVLGTNSYDGYKMIQESFSKKG